MDKKLIAGIPELLANKKQKIVITAHHNPDGDAIGSSLGLHHFLNNLGLKSTVIMPNDCPDFLKWMPGADKIINLDYKPTRCKERIAEADLIFHLDYNALHRAYDLEKPLEEATATKILIDHHQQPTDFADYTLSDPTACSTAQLVVEFIQALEMTEHIDSDVAQNLYCGFITDTSSFKYRSVTAQTHLMVAELMQTGFDHEYVHRMLFDQNRFERLQLMGFALNQRLVHRPECEAAYFYLSEADIKQFDFKKGDTEGLVNYALSIKGVRLAGFFKEQEGAVKLSLRSEGDLDVNQMAREHFRGGGHKNAAGGRLELPIADVVALFEKVIAER